MPRIYISHRPEDSSRNEVAVIRERLIAEFGADNILQSTGSNMEITTNLQRLVWSCDVLLIVVGRYWANMVDERGHLLLDDPYDPIHVEIDAGLKSTMVMTVLVVDDAPIPQKKQLPYMFQSLLNKVILEAPDHTKLERILDELVDLWTKIPAGTRQIKSNRNTQKFRQMQPSNNNMLASAIGIGIVFISCLLVTLFVASLGDENRVSIVSSTSNNTTPKFLSDEPITASNVDRLTVLEELSDSFNFYQVSKTGAEIFHFSQREWCTYNTIRREKDSCDPTSINIAYPLLWEEQTNVWFDLNRIGDEISMESEQLETKTFKLESPVAVASFSTDDTGRAVVGGRSGELLWIDYQENNYTTAVSVFTNDEYLSEIQLQIDPSQQRLLIDYDNQIQLWDVQTREQIEHLKFESDIEYTEFISLFGELQIFTVTDDGMIYYFSADTLETDFQTSFFNDAAYPRHKVRVTDVSSTGLMAVSRDKFTLELWDLYSEELVYEDSFYLSTEDAQFTATSNVILFFIPTRGFILGVEPE